MKRSIFYLRIAFSVFAAQMQYTAILADAPRPWGHSGSPQRWGNSVITVKMWMCMRATIETQCRLGSGEATCLLELMINAGRRVKHHLGTQLEPPIVHQPQPTRRQLGGLYEGQHCASRPDNLNQRHALAQKRCAYPGTRGANGAPYFFAERSISGGPRPRRARVVMANRRNRPLYERRSADRTWVSDRQCLRAPASQFPHHTHQRVGHFGHKLWQTIGAKIYPRN